MYKKHSTKAKLYKNYNHFLLLQKNFKNFLVPVFHLAPAGCWGISVSGTLTLNTLNKMNL